jgi:carbon storage regulator
VNSPSPSQVGQAFQPDSSRISGHFLKSVSQERLTYKEPVMLVLSRKPGQSIVIAGNIVVNIVEIDRGRVQIGVAAPPHVSIHREEVQQRIQQESRPVQLPNRPPLAERMARVLQPAGVCN